MTELGVRSGLLDAVPGVSHRFFSRVGGTSPAPWRGLNTSLSVGDAPARVEENLARVRFQIGVPRRGLVSVSQVHGKHVLEVPSGADPEALRAREADGLFTRAEHLGVAVRTADCAPILLAARDGSAVAAVHAGWRGAVGGVLEEAVAVFAAHGVAATDVVAAVGPCIGQAAFEVGPEVIAQASAACDLGGLVIAGRGDRQHLDLAGLCVRVLERAGVEAERVGGCTATTVDEEGELVYFSHRREHGRTGRQMSAIARTEPPVLDAAMFG